MLGCARFAEILSELTKTWSSGATECGVWIGNCNVKVWKSTEHKLHNIWRSVKFQQNEHTPGLEWAPTLYISLRLCVQNRRKKWNFPLNFRTMHKLSDLYSGIFQTQSSGCASGVDLFRNFTKLKILNIWIVKYLLNCKRYLSYNFRIFQKISECWVLENLDVHLERNTSELEFWNFQHAFLQFSEHTEISTCFFTVFRICWKFQHALL